MSSSVDGPLKLQLRRSLQGEPKLWVQRWKVDHPITIALTPSEVDELEAAIAIYREQVAVESQAATSTGSLLELGPLARLAIGRAA